MAVALCAKGDQKRFLVGIIVEILPEHLVVHYYSSGNGDEFGVYKQVIDPASQLKGRPWRGEFDIKDVVVCFDDFEDGKIPQVAVDQIFNSLKRLS